MHVGIVAALSKRIHGCYLAVIEVFRVKALRAGRIGQWYRLQLHLATAPLPR
jgi:hypothetical protein